MSKIKCFTSRIKEIAFHISHFHCVIHRQYLAAKCLGGEMKEALNVATSAINFIKVNSVNDIFFQEFCNDKQFKKLLMHTELKGEATNFACSS